MSGPKLAPKVYLNYVKIAYEKGDIDKQQYEEAVTRAHNPYYDLKFISPRLHRKRI